MPQHRKIRRTLVIGFVCAAAALAQTDPGEQEMSLEQYLGIPPLSSYDLPRIPFVPRQDKAPARSLKLNRKTAPSPSSIRPINVRTSPPKFTPARSNPQVLPISQMAALPRIPRNPPAPEDSEDTTAIASAAAAPVEFETPPALEPEPADEETEVSLAEEAQGSVPADEGDAVPLPRVPNPNRLPYKRSNQRQPTVTRYLEIQQALAERGYTSAEIDGKWGPSWIDALKHFQNDQGLDHDGKLGALTLTALGLGPRSGNRPALAGATSPQRATVE